MAQNKKDYILNFKTNVEGLDKVFNDLKKLSTVEGINIGAQISKDLQRAEVELKAFKDQLATALDSADLSNNDLLVMDKQLAQIIKTLSGVSKGFAGILPKETQKEIVEFSNSLEKNLELLKAAQKSVRAYDLHLSKDENGNLLGLRERYKNASLKTAAGGSYDNIDLGDGIKVNSYEEFAKALAKVRQEAKLTTEQLQKLAEIEAETERLNKEKLDKILGRQAAKQAEVDAIQKEIAAQQQQANAVSSSTSATKQLSEIEQQYAQTLNKSIVSLSKLEVGRLDNNNALHAEINAKNSSVDSERQLKSAIDQTTKSREKNTSILGQATRQVITYGGAVSLLRNIVNTTRRTIEEMDEALTGMAVVTTMSREQAWELTTTFQDLANETGKTTAEIANMATKFYQQGKSTTQVIELTRAAAMAASIAGIDGSRSIDLLTNAMNGFQMSATQALEVSDKFAALAAAAATDYEELAVALSKVAAQANLAGMSMDFTLGLLTAGIEVTREAPETIGTALKTIIARMRELTDYGKTLEDGVDVNRVAAALDNIGIALMDETGQFRDLEEVITEIGQKWNTLNKNQQANVAVAMAGTRQQSRFIAMMQDFERTQELVNISANSYGATLAQQAKYMGGLEAATNKLTTAYQALITGITDSEIFIQGTNFIASIVSGIDSILNNAKLLIPLLALAGVYGLSRLGTTIQENRLKKEQIDLEQKDLSLKRQQEIVRLQTVKQEIEQSKKSRQQLILDTESLLIEQQEKVLIAEQNVELAKQFLIQAKMQGNATKIAQAQDELTKATTQLHQEEAERSKIQQKLTDLKTEDTKLAILQSQEMAYQATQGNILQRLANSLGGIFSTFTGALTTISGIYAVIAGLFKKMAEHSKNMTKDSKEQVENAAKKVAIEQMGDKADNAADRIDDVVKNSAKNATAGASGTSLLSGAGLKTAASSLVSALKAALPALAVVAAIAAIGASIYGLVKANEAFKNSVENTTEAINQTSVELYNLQQSATNVSKVADEFEELHSKVYKTNEELARMDELAQQINDEAGFNVVDLNADQATQLAQIQAYQDYTQSAVENKTEDMQTALSSGITTARNTNKWLGVAGTLGTIFGFGGIFTALGGVALSMRKSEEELQQIQEEIIKSEAGREAINTLMSQNSDFYADIESNDIKDALIDIMGDNWQQFFDKNNNLLYDKISASFETINFETLDSALNSGSLTELSNAFIEISNSGNQYADALLESIPVMKTIKEFGVELTNDLGELGLTLDDINSIYALMGSSAEEVTYNLQKYAKQLEDIMSNTQLSEDEKREQAFDTLTENTIKNAMGLQKAIENNDTTGKYGEKVLAYNEAKSALEDPEYKKELREAEENVRNASEQDKEAMYEKYLEVYNRLAEERTLVNSMDNAFTNALEDTDAAAEALFGGGTAQQNSESIISLTSMVQNLAEKTDLANLSFQEQQELLKEYPQLQKAVARGYLTAQEQAALFSDELAKIKENASIIQGKNRNIVESKIGDFMFRGSNFTELAFSNTEEGLAFRTELLTLDEEGKQEYIDALIAQNIVNDENQAEEMLASVINSVIEYQDAQNQLDFIEKNGVAGLMSEETKQALQDALNPLTQARAKAEAYATTLERLNKNSEEYAETLAKWEQTAFQMNKELKNEQDKLDKQKLDIFGGDERLANLVSFVNGEMIIDPSATEKDLELIGLKAEELSSIAKQYYDIEEERYSLNESRIQQVIDLEQELSDQRVKALEAQQAAYEDYFSEVDAAREEAEYEQDRESLIKQIAGLAGGADSASKQQMKDLQQQLRELEEEQLDTQRENQRDALLQRIEDAIENEQTIMDNLNNAITELVNWLQETDATPEQIKDQIDNVKDGKLTPYATGGLVKTTGPVMVHGTPSKPEAFLSAADTQNMRNLFDALNLVTGVKFNNSVTDIEQPANYTIEQITIQPAQLNNNQDWAQAGNILATEIFKASKKRGITFNVKK